MAMKKYSRKRKKRVDKKLKNRKKRIERRKNNKRQDKIRQGMRNNKTNSYTAIKKR